MKRSDDHHVYSWFPLPDGHFLNAVWRLCCAVIFFWGAWASSGRDWFADAPVVPRAAVAGLFLAIAVGLVVQAFAEWKKCRSRRAGPDAERIDSPR